MSQPTPSQYHPRRWTALTWFVILCWSLSAVPPNYPPSVSYSVDPVTGAFTNATRIESLAELPFPIGWPLHYVTSSDSGMPGPWPLGAPPPPTPPARVSPLALVFNVVLVAIVLAALVYLLQKKMRRFTVRTILLLMAAFPLYLVLGRLVTLIAGPSNRFEVFVYFSPIAIAIAERFSLLRWAWLRADRLRVRWKARNVDVQSLDNPDAAIAAAAKLDMAGDWSRAIEVYREAAEQWPEHAEYIRNCIRMVEAKQALTQT